MKHIWKKSPAAHLLFACLLSIALLPGCIQDPYEMQGSDRISFGATTAAPDDGLSTKGGDGLSLLADGWFVALGSEEGADVAWQPEPQTKTSYSGYDEDGNLISNTAGTTGANTTSAYERIDWVAGDSVTVISRQAYVRDRSTTPYGVVQSHGTYSRMNYGVTDLGTSSGQNHSAKLSPADGDGLLWDSSNNNSHYFIAVYPATAADNFSIVGTSNVASFSGEILESQPPKGQRTLTENGRQVLEFLPDMEKVYMCAGSNAKQRSTGSDIALNFKPMVSAARFTIRAADVGGGTLKLQKATLATTNTSTSYALAGKMSCQINYQGQVSNMSTTDTKQSVEIPLPDVQLGDRDIRLTFIALRNGRNQLKLTLEFEGGVTRSLELKRGTSNISWGQNTKLYFDLAGISYMPSYDLPDAIWGWTQDVFTAPVPENVVDGDGEPATPTVSYSFKDGTGTDDIATVSGDQITCGTAAGKRILVVSVTVGPVTAETEIPVYVQKLDRVEIDEPAEGHNVRVGANYVLPYTVYWQRPEDDGTVVEMSTDDATTIYNATTADLAGFYPEVSIPAASQAYVALSTRPVTIKGVAPIAAPGTSVTLSITDGSHSTKPTHIVSDDTNVFVTDPPFQSARIISPISENGYRMWAGDGQVGRIYGVRVDYEDGSYDIFTRDNYADGNVSWTPGTGTDKLTITSDGYVTVGTNYGYGGVTAEFTDRYGVSRTVNRTEQVRKFESMTLVAYDMITYYGPNQLAGAYLASTTRYVTRARISGNNYSTEVDHSYFHSAIGTSWDISAITGKASDSDAYGTYIGSRTGGSTGTDCDFYYLWAYQLNNSSVVPPAGHTYKRGSVSRTATRSSIPYAEPSYQNHKNQYSPITATAYHNLTN